MSSISRFMRKVQLIGQSRKQVVESALLDHAGIEVLLGDGEMGAC
jgi:hypothetical protein